MPTNPLVSQLQITVARATDDQASIVDGDCRSPKRPGLRDKKRHGFPISIQLPSVPELLMAANQVDHIANGLQTDCLIIRDVSLPSVF
jgi:hypothetical protein